MFPSIVLLYAMSKECMAIHSAIEILAPAVKLVERILVEEKPFASYRYTSRIEGHQTEWTFHLLETGIGKAHIVPAIQLVIVRYQSQPLVNVGVLGGPYAGAQAGGLCFSTAYRYHDI